MYEGENLPERLALDRPVLVMDNRGVGESSIGERPFTLVDFAEDVLFLLDHLGWRWAHVFGVSMGGMIVQQLLLLAPERVGKAVIGCSSAGSRLAGPAVHPEFLALSSAKYASEAERVRAILGASYGRRYRERHPQFVDDHFRRALTFHRPRRGLFFQNEAIVRPSRSIIILALC